MASTTTVEFRTQAGGHYLATRTRGRGRTNYTLALLETSDANEFNLPDDGTAKEYMFVYDLPAVGPIGGGEGFRALEYVDGNPENLAMHISSPVVWVPEEEQD